jgi:two-component system sensor histidine kinase VicK
MFQQLQDYNQELERRVREQTAQIHAHYTQLRAILNSSSDGIIVTDETGTIIDTNPVVDTLFEQQLSPADGEKLREVVREMSLSAAERPEKMLEFADVDLQLNAALIGDQGGKGASSVVMLHDISHLKALDRMKSRFVSDVSHELRTPVTTITLLISLLKRSPPERWEIYLDGLEQEAKRQSQLIHDILQVSRIDSGRLTLNVDYVNLEELAEDVILAHKVLAESRDLTLVYQRTGKRLIVSVDQAQISQVLNNLVENAIQYTPEGGQITVTTDRRHAEGQDWATLAVSDTGIGIPEHELQHIFERFYRGEQPRQKQISGTGLGLAIAKEILALHGGRVIVESQPNVGSTFVVWLPLGASRVE